MSEEKNKQDVVDEEISEPTEATKEQSEAQNAEESVVDASHNIYIFVCKTGYGCISPYPAVQTNHYDLFPYFSLLPLRLP